jgi:uncharacterized protein YbaR (Trm112 family)/SAM-dependent methyltransferase
LNEGLLELLCCPKCLGAQLDLTSFESSNGEIASGFLRCGSCGRFYFIVDGIARLITEQFAPLIATSWAVERREQFGPWRTKLDEFLHGLEKSETEESAKWNLDDIAFWEGEVYSDPTQRDRYLAGAERSRSDAGNRTYPREKHIFSHVREEVLGRTVVDLGCGYSQTVRALMNPQSVDYRYIGTDLAVSALVANRQTLRGEFVQCSVDALPFAKESIDIALCLGTLHHLHRPHVALETILETVRPGGLLGLHEVIGKKRTVAKWRRPVESAHNAAIDPDRTLAILRSECEVIDLKLEYSPIRGLVVSRLGEAMRTRPWLTRGVIRMDDVVIGTLGRAFPLFGSRSMVALARKHG